MSDSEAPGDPAESSEVEPQPSFVTPDPSPPQSPDLNEGDVSADVAPSRKTRRRPEARPPVKVQEELLGKPERETVEASSESAVAQGGWGYWGSWGKSILSTATATVATVGQGITQVIEKAETSLGMLSPTEPSAEREAEQGEGAEGAEGEEGEEEKPQVEAGHVDGEAGWRLGGGWVEAGHVDGEAGSPVGSAIGMLSSLSSVVQSTGKTVLTGGLDALEFLGKKTMDVIAEGDPGFRKTKGLMIRNSTLSQVLREAKEREEQQTLEEVSVDTEKKAHYGMLFDEFQGLSHLEALEILSRESESKVKSVLNTLSGGELFQLRADLDLINGPFSLVEFDDEDVDEKRDDDGSEFLRELTEALNGLHIPATADKLGKATRGACEQIAQMTKPVEKEEEEEEQQEEGTKTYTVEDVHSSAIRCLAELTARSIEQFHKVAEMILLSPGSEVTTLEQASILSQITIVLCKEVSLLSKKFTSSLATIGTSEKGEVLNPLITGVFLEASNSASYIQDAFQLLLPVLQVSHIQRRADSTQP